MNPQLTCSQRQWLHSWVGRASHRYSKVTGSNPVEVLNFFQASLRNCINWFTATIISSFSVLSYVHETSHKVRETSYTERGFNVSKTARKRGKSEKSKEGYEHWLQYNFQRRTIKLHYVEDLHAFQEWHVHNNLLQSKVTKHR